MKRLLLVLTVLFLAAGPAARAEDAPLPYYVPPAQFNAEMRIMSLGFSNIFGLFRSGTGSFSFDAAGKSVSRLRLALDATSLTANNGDNQRDLANLLDTTQYPEIDITAPDSVAFVDGKAELKATVTLHGVSKPVTVTATLNHVGKSPYGGDVWSKQGDAVGVSLHMSLKRADFGMGDDPKADAPSPFGDTIDLTVELQAIQQ